MSETYDDYESWEEERRVSPLSLAVIVVMALTSAAIIGNALLRQPNSAGVVIMKDVRNEHLKSRASAKTGENALEQVNRQAMTLTIQNALMIAGYYAGPLDGMEGRQTEEAIAAYQDSIGLNVTGKVSQQLYDILTRRKELPTGSIARVQSVKFGSTKQPQMPGTVLIAKPEPQPQSTQVSQKLDILPRIKPAGSTSKPTVVRSTARLKVTPKPVPRKLASNGPVPPESIPVATASVSATGDPVLAKVQQALKNIGFENLTVDGVMGSQTSSAIEHFQRSRGHPVTGQVNDRLLQEMMIMGYLDLG